MEVLGVLAVEGLCSIDVGIYIYLAVHLVTLALGSPIFAHTASPNSIVITIKRLIHAL